MNSFKLLVAALMFGAFSLTITGCPGKKADTDVENAAEDMGDTMGDAATDATDAVEDAAEDVTEDAE